MFIRNKLQQEIGGGHISQGAPTIEIGLQLCDILHHVFCFRREVLLQQVKLVITLTLRGATCLIADNVTNKAEVTEELIVNDVILTTVEPEHIGPIDVDLTEDTLRRGFINQPQRVLQFCLEMLELGQWLTTGVHLDIELIRQAHVLNGQEIE